MIAKHRFVTIGAFHGSSIRVGRADLGIGQALIPMMAMGRDTFAAVLFFKASWCAIRLWRSELYRLSSRYGTSLLVLSKQGVEMLFCLPIKTGHHRVNIRIGLDFGPIEVEFLAPDQLGLDT